LAGSPASVAGATSVGPSAVRLDPRVVPRLLNWFAKARRPLPWRARREAYPIWIAEVLLQQTRVAQAVPYYRRFLDRFPTVEALAAADLDAVLKAWEGAGYYARARHLHAAARAIVADRGGRLPRTRDAWRTLPGVGDYIAAAVASLAYGEPVLALEANGLRVGARLAAETAPIDRARTRRRLGEALEARMPADAAGAFNEALMELGETICLPRKPRCGECPLPPFCRARATLADPGALPTRSPRPPKPAVRAAVVAVQWRDRLLVRRRPMSGLLGGLWELPGGKIEADELPRAAARRELREETGLRVGRLVPRGTIRHEYSHFRVTLYAFTTSVGGARPPAVRGGRWATRAAIDRLALPKATRRLLSRLPERPSARRGGARPGSRSRPGHRASSTPAGARATGRRARAADGPASAGRRRARR